jgi:cobalt/nickel transport system permease protein
MLIEQSAYANRWRRVSPAAKGLFSLCGMVAAYNAATPAISCSVAAVLSAVAVLGAGIPPGRYLKVAAPALLFLATSAATLLFSMSLGGASGTIALSLVPTELPRVAQVCARSLGGLTALLFLAMTTPLSDIIALLRRLRAPEVLLDIMVICYRTIFVFSEAVRDTMTAQSARLGYSTHRLALRSLGCLVATITAQIWHRSQTLHIAALARNNDGPLRFLEHIYPNPARDLCIAFSGGFTVIAFAVLMS